jgi:thiol-disulfide isomerase/thioredoxin
MKTKFILFLLSVLITFSAFSQTFTYTPQHPKAGDKVSFTYNPKGAAFTGKGSISFAVYHFNVLDNKNGTIDVTTSQKAGNYTGSFEVPATAHLMALQIAEGENKDNNKQKGFLIPVHDATGKLVAGSKMAESNVFAGMGDYYLGIDPNTEKALASIEEEWNTNSAIRNKIMPQYMGLLNRVKKQEAAPQIEKIINDALATGNLAENDYGALAAYANAIKMVEKSKAITAEMKTKFPEGNWKKNMDRAAFNKIEDLDKRLIAIDDFIAKNPHKDDAEKAANSRLYSALINTYLANKNGVEMSKLKEYASKLAPEMRPALYNNVSWNWVDKKDTMYSQSEELSRLATLWAKEQINNPTTPKPDLFTNAMWLESRSNTYGMYANTYAYILHKLKDNSAALKYAKEGCEITKWKRAEYNDLYAKIGGEILPAEQLIKELSPLVQENAAGSSTKEALKKALISKTGSETEANKTITALAESAQMKAKEELAKKILNNESKDFNLLNMEGKQVQLASLKGKVVVVDFWATWCGPCIASFPGMQKTINKYKSNPDVAFVFINTWENQDTKEKRTKEVTDFIAKNKYDFNVLYDEKDKSDNYQVITSYKVDGIPTKFIIGKDGKVKFKSVGGDSNADKLVTELSAMIEMASN